MLIPVTPLPEKSQKELQSKICTSFALLTPLSGSVDGVIACQEVGNGALSEYTLNIGVVADAMSGVVVNVCLRVFPVLCQGGNCSVFVGVGRVRCC